MCASSCWHANGTPDVDSRSMFRISDNKITGRWVCQSIVIPCQRTSSDNNTHATLDLCNPTFSKLIISCNGSITPPCGIGSGSGLIAPSTLALHNISFSSCCSAAPEFFVERLFSTNNDFCSESMFGLGGSARSDVELVLSSFVEENFC